MRRLLAALAVAALLAAPAALGAPDPLRGQQYGLDLVESDSAHTITTGTGASVAIVDSGVRLSHEDLQGRLLPGRDFVADPDDSTPEDGNGHGTHVLGIAVANSDNGRGVSSVAPGAQALPIRVLDEEGNGSSDDVAAGINHAVDRGVSVINLSLGDTVPLSPVISIIGSDDPVYAAIDRALDKGIVVVAASGNSSLPVCEQPALEGRLLCVGAVDQRRQRAYYSSSVGQDGVVAPGGPGNFLDHDILSTFHENRQGPADNGYEELAGTSQAAPHAAGVAALLVSCGLRGQDVVNRIRQTATDVGPAGPDADHGAGLVNARAAVSGFSSGPCAPSSAPPPSSQPPSSSPPSSNPPSSNPPSGNPPSSNPPSGNPPPPVTPRVFIAREQRYRDVARRGIVLRCRTPRGGRCSATATNDRRLIAAGSSRVRAGQTVTVSARLTRAGRVKLRRSRSLRVNVRVSIPGARAQVHRIVLRR